MQNLYLSRIQNSIFKGIFSKSFVLFLILLSSFKGMIAQTSWDGNFDATYNPCDGSITITIFAFENKNGDDRLMSNTVFQFRDNTGSWQKICVLRCLRAMNFQTERIPSWNNADNWRGDNGAIINSASHPGNTNSSAINVYDNNGSPYHGFVYSTSATKITCPQNSTNCTGANDLMLSNFTNPEPIIIPSVYQSNYKSYISLKWINPPAYLRNQANVELRMPFALGLKFNGSILEGCPECSPYGSNIPASTKNVSIQPIATIQGLTATKNTNCNTVTLNWAGINDYCDYAHYQVFRDGVAMFPIDNFSILPVMNGSSPSNTFTDNSPVKGQNHSYAIKIIHQDANFWWFGGNISSSAIGKVKSSPPAPYGLTATDNKCNKTIELAWSVNQSIADATPHASFLVRRSTTANFATYADFNNIGEGARSFIDTSVSYNQTYYYKVYAHNGCLPPNVVDYSPESNIVTGIAPGNPPLVTSIAVDSIPVGKVRIIWNDPSPYESNYIVTRSLLTGGGSTDLVTLSANSTQFVDSLAQICVDYVYKIKATNVCNTSGVESNVLGQIKLNPSLGNTFQSGTTKILKASKGYFPNRVELNWTNNNGASITGWKIYRKNMTTGTGDSVLIASPSASTGQYIDYTTDANIFYKYTIVGEALCGNTTLKTNTSEDIGFRYPSGTISGHVSYEGGINVKDVKVTAQTTSGTSGYALNFSGDNISGAQIASSTTLNNNTPYTIEFWMKPTVLLTSGTILKKRNYSSGSTHYAIEYNQPTNMIDFYYQQGSTIQKVSANFGLSTGTYVHITAVKDNNSLKLFKNGVLLNSFTTTTPLTSIPNVPIDLGYNSNTNTNKFAGNIDELRIYKRAKDTTEISRDFNRYINPEDNDLVAYFPLDENINSFGSAYDLSKSNNIFNENKLTFNSGVTFNSSIPNNAQLNNIGYTDTNGFYVINACKYNSTGQNFTITPLLGTHSFTPTNRIEFVGEGSTIKSNVDFTDNSSFLFNGKVMYKNSSCAMEGAVVYIDDAAVIKAGEIIKSDADGKFQIRVPIGEHFVSVKYPYHDFSVGRFPLAPGTQYNFQANVPGEVPFVDSTLRKVVGRVVGGQVEGGKALNLGRSINNIGKARLIFETIKGDGCKKDTVWTVDSSGEYTAYLLPIKYKVGDIRIPSNLGMNFVNSEGIGKQVDLSLAYELKSIKDTVYRYIDSAGRRIRQYVRTDSTKYHETYSYIHRTPATILMKGNYETNAATHDSLFIGEPFLTMGPTDTVKLLPFNPGSSIVPYPVFKQYTEYTAKFETTEDYKNYDISATNPKVTRYPVNGVLNITNYIGTNSGSFSTGDSGMYKWTFMTGIPNLTSNNLVPQYSYTNPLQVTFNSEGANSIEYLPFPLPNSNGDKLYRAFVFGKRSLGSNFVTRDVDKVEFILRDPPGTNSFASWTRGSKTIDKKYSAHEGNYGGAVEASLGTGGGTEVYAGGGFGFMVLTKIAEVETTVSAEAKASYNYKDVSSSSATEEVENLETISTSSSEDEVGHMADVFIGYGKNTIFGGSVQISIVDTAQCNLAAFECFGAPFGKYQLAKSSVLSVGEGQAKTRFTYTTREIEDIVIPNLINLRNNLFVQYPQVYKLNFTNASDKVKYGSNNDDKYAWGTQVSSANAREDNYSDSTGQSYTFYPAKNGIADSVKAIKKVACTTPACILANFPSLFYDSVYYIKIPSKDKVREYNKQILQWKIELAKNEREKYKALGPNGPTQNVDNLSIGTAVIQKTMTSSSEKVWTEENHHTMAAEIGVKLQTEIQVVGVELDLEVGASATTEQTWTNGTEETQFKSTTFDYVFQDENQGDLINIAVKNPEDGGGHIFKVLAGQTSCPYQAAEYLKWYNPTANDNSDNFIYLYPSSESGSTIEFSPRTVQIDVPTIQVAQSTKINIPSDEPAVFNMILGNESEANKTRDYTLKVDLVSNPFGAIIKVDGLDPNRTFTIPAGVGINKVITVEKGPTKFNYDSILLIFHTACDIDKENIADSVYISAHFIPACNKATLQSPGDLWVANNITGDTLPIIINGYNYNFEGFSNIQFKYKKSNTSIWNTQEIFYRDTTGLNNPNAKLIPTTNNFIDYKWAIKDNTDGPYDIKLDVRCDFQNFPNIVREMPKQIGIIDKINPLPFGTPSPADGILDPNDDISIQFNEPLDNGTLTYSNFDIRGVLNETPIRNSTSLFFNGTSNYMEVPGDVNLQQRDFTIETWVKRGDIGRKQTIFSQGSDANQAIEIGFDTDNKLYYRVGSGTNNEMIKSDNSFTDLTDWHHLALTYNHTAEEVQMYWDGTYVNGNVTNHMYTDNLSTGKMQIAKNLSTNNQYFKGNLHEIRVWNKFRTLSEIAQTMNKTVNRSNPGTLFNWKLDEAEGTQAKDDIRERNATIYGATWMVDPSSKSIALNGSNQYVKVESGNYGITKEMDMTLELWFNSAQTGVASLLSNGKGYQHTDSITAWNIEKDASGKIHVKNNNFDWVATDSNYFDGQWHHLAIVLNRKANTILYIDGNQQKAISSQKFGEFGGGNVYLGALGYYNGSLFNAENYLNGNIDEFRFWNTARLVEQIKRDKQNRLKGDEYGLLSYVPFEEYVEVSGVPSLNATMKDIADTSHDITPMNSATHSAMTPTLKLPRAVQSIQFTYVLNNDKIILTPTTAAKFIENVTLDITTKGVKDKNGNYQQSPKTWIAYIDKNQVVWGNDAFFIDKKLNEARTINTSIANNGGATKQFTIDNIPSWMTVKPTSGVIAPNSVLPVTIEIDENLAIGDYENDVQLLTDFGFAEKLNIKVKCRANAPVWTVDASKFQYSMNIIGKLKINQVISSDIEDKIAIFVGDVCRGVANVKYVPQYDDYYVFIDVYSNDVSGAEVFKSKIWDASVGAILTDVTPEVLFESNTLKGTMSTPIIFNANNTFAQVIPINSGWNWLSVNVISNDSNHFDRLLKTLNSTNGDAIKSQTSHRLFNTNDNWIGSLTSVIPDKGYMLKSTVDDTLVVDGVLANPTLRPINLVTGWNWIGFNSIRNLSLNQALGGLNPVHEDLIKGKNNFAVYDQAIGWIGSLSAMKPGEGYLYKSAGTNSFYYPIAGYYKGGIDEDELKNTYFDVKSNEFESNMSLIVKLNCSGLDKNSTQTLAALDEKGICRGAIKLKYLESIQTPIAFLSIAGNTTENLNFKLYDETSKKLISINETISFTPNSIMGSIQFPYTLKVSNDACSTLSIASNIPLNDYYVNVFPNEIKNDINIEFGGKVNDIVRFELYDIQGKSLVQFEKNRSQLNRKFTLNSMYPSISELAGGVYLLKVEINGQSQTFKLVK